MTGSNHNLNQSQNTPALIDESQFKLDNFENVSDPEFVLDIDQLYQIKVNYYSSNQNIGNRLKKKKEWGPKWFDKQKKVIEILHSNTKLLRTAKTAANCKNPHLVYKALIKIYQEISEELK